MRARSQIPVSFILAGFIFFSGFFSLGWLWDKTPKPKDKKTQGSQKPQKQPPDLTVSISSIGPAKAENRNPNVLPVQEAQKDPAYIWITIPLTVKVKNIGQGTAKPVSVSVSLEASGSPVGLSDFMFRVLASKSIEYVFFDSPLAAGNEASFSGTLIGGALLADYKKMEGRTIKIKTIVDPKIGKNPLVPESDETNNLSDWSNIILPKAVTTGLKPEGASDLSVSIGTLLRASKNPEGKETGNLVAVPFTIRNKGKVDSEPAEWIVTYFKAGRWIEAARGGVGVIKRGDSFNISSDAINLPSGSTRIRVSIDPDNLLKENNTGNNVAEINP